MSSRFNNIFEREKYVPVIQELPYEALANLGESMQKEKDALDLQSLKLQELWKNKKYISEDRDYVKQMDAEYVPILNNLAKLIQTGDPKARPALFEAQSKIANDQRFNTLALNYETKDRAMKERAALEKEGKWSRWNWSDGFSQAASSRKELTPINYTSHNPWFSPEDDAAPLIAGINSSSKKVGGDAFDIGPNGKLIIKGGYTKIGGVNEARVIDEAQRTLDIFKRTNGGVSLEKDLYAQGLTNQKDRDLYMTKYLFDLAHKQVNSEFEQMNTLSGVGEHYNKDDSSVPQSTFLSSKTLPSNIADKFMIDKSGTTKKVLNFIKESLNPWPLPKPNLDRNTNLQGPQNKKLLQAATKAYGVSTPATEEAQIKLINKYVEDWGKQIIYEPVGVRTDLKTLKSEDELMFERGQSTIREYVDMETGETIQGKNLTKEFGDASTKSNSIKYGPDNPYGLPSANIVTLTTKDGKVKQLIAKPVQGSYTQDEVIRNQMYNAKYNPLYESKVELPAEKSDGTKTTVVYTVKYEPIYDLNTLDENGRPIRTGEKVMLLDKNDQLVTEPIEGKIGEDVIHMLYKKLEGN